MYSYCLCCMLRKLAYLSVNLICLETNSRQKVQMFSMLHAFVIKAKISDFLFHSLGMYKLGQKEKRMLDLSKPIISNSHTLITLLRWKASGLGSHILKLNLLVSQKKHLVLPCCSTTSSNNQQTQNPRQ